MTVDRGGGDAGSGRGFAPGGGDLVSRDLIRALTVDGGPVRFVIEAATPDEARALAPAQAEAEAR